MRPTRRPPFKTIRLATGIAVVACIAASPTPARDDLTSPKAQVEVIRSDQLAVLSVDNGRTRVLYTSSLVEQGALGYRDLGPLLVFANDEVQPGSGFKLHSHENVEVITIVLEGSLDHADTAGHSGRVKTGEVALMSAGGGVKHSEFGNPDVLTRSVTIWLKPRTMNKTPGRVTAKPIEKDGWQLIAAERDAPLIVDQDARVLMKRIAPRKHVRLVAKPGRLVYLGTVDGELFAGDYRLSAPERIVLRGGEIKVTSETGATVVLVDVPLE
jgi:redox-sensitive bicupin YhaK (pirin superfamily)